MIQNVRKQINKCYHIAVMGIVTHIFKKRMLHRYDKDGYTPYLSSENFAGLNKETYTFINSLGVEISYFYYYYDNYNPNLVILFLHGLGPGHTAYIREIETLAKMGYKVLTLDYMGCDSSKGDKLPSLNEPTRDVDDLLNLLKLKEPVVVIGHSLGAYTTLNIMNIRDELKKAVVISGFLRPDIVLNALLGTKMFSGAIARYEKKIEPKYYPIDNFEYVKNTQNKLMFIHSKDDPVVNYDAAMKPVFEANNPNIQVVTVDGRGHNPNYSDEAAKLVTEVFAKYYKLKKDEDKKKLMENLDPWMITEQDLEIFKKIKEFIEES